MKNEFYYTYVPYNDYCGHSISPRTFRDEQEAINDAKERNVYFRAEKTDLSFEEFTKEISKATFC